MIVGFHFHVEVAKIFLAAGIPICCSCDSENTFIKYVLTVNSPCFMVKSGIAVQLEDADKISFQTRAHRVANF